MTRNERIKYYIDAISQEVFGYISENSDSEKDGWISTVRIKDDLGLKVPEYPQNKDKSARGWLFGIAARRLEDVGMIEYDNSGTRSYCRVKENKGITF
ncbi:MAG: hypothetical protein JEZ11_07900 [Desulfobacterales bacterium]|nr:hypothetical protein [Desulfobacterales bacterium]